MGQISCEKNSVLRGLYRQVASKWYVFCQLKPIHFVFSVASNEVSNALHENMICFVINFMRWYVFNKQTFT